MLTSDHGVIIEEVYAVGRVWFRYTEKPDHVEGTTVEGATNRVLCGRDESASDQDTVIKVQHSDHVQV